MYRYSNGKNRPGWSRFSAGDQYITGFL